MQQKLYTINMSSRKTLPHYDELLDAQRVLINPLNQSLSKQQYSFSKAQRFDRCLTHNDSYRFYDLPSTRSRVSTTIGRETRDQIPRNHPPHPSPLKYCYAKDGEFGYSIHHNSKRNKGCTFRLGRDEVKVNSFLNMPGASSPDPGTYNPEKNSRSLEKQYSFAKAKKSSIGDNLLPSLIPGPGAYRVQTSLSEQKQLLSIHPKVGAPKLVQLKVQNKKGPTRYPPLYNPKTTAKGKALDFSRTSKGVIIGSAQRNSTAKNVIPGPGQYKIFSEFIGKGKA